MKKNKETCRPVKPKKDRIRGAAQWKERNVDWYRMPFTTARRGESLLPITTPDGVFPQEKTNTNQRSKLGARSNLVKEEHQRTNSQGPDLAGIQVIWG